MNVAQMVIAHKSEARKGFGANIEATDPLAHQRPADTTPEEDAHIRDVEAIEQAQADLANEAENTFTSKNTFIGTKMNSQKMLENNPLFLLQIST